MAHRPAALRAFSGFVLAVMAGDALPYGYKELAYLKASMGAECEHCVASHSRYASQAGYSAEQIAALGSYRESPLFSDEEKAILHFSEQTTLRPGPCPAALVEELQRFFSDAQIVELTLVIGIANTFGRFNNALGVGVDGAGPGAPGTSSLPGSISTKQG
jgi:AhpD family alkylhydroperoxidase